MLKTLLDYWGQRRRSQKLRERFTVVHDANLWGGNQSRSGAGSEPGTPSVVVAENAIEKAVREHDVQSINDIPCGDFHWMPGVLARLGPVRYRGFDIVPALVASNKAQFPDREFHALDVTSEPPPPADLIFCKDLFNHLGDRDVKRAIDNMRRSGSTFLLASNNSGYPNGPLPNVLPGSRLLDLCAAPFSFNPPLWTLDGYMCLWRLADMGECGF